jgi:hypothetical protein
MSPNFQRKLGEFADQLKVGAVAGDQACTMAAGSQSD